MTMRRSFMQSSTVVAAAAPRLSARAGTQRYQAAADAIWRRNSTATSNVAAQRREWVRLATLAASSHNSQPWKFRVLADSIVIAPDYARRCQAVDPDDSHLFRSLGCAAENLVHAAAADGFAAQVRFDAAQDAVLVAFERSAAAQRDNLAAAILESASRPPPCGGRPPRGLSKLRAAVRFLKRRCTRTPYDAKPIAASAQAALLTAASMAGVTPLFLESAPQKEAMIDYVRQGNVAQFEDPGFVNELREWVRFNEADAVAAGDGLAGAVSGQPSIPGWFGRFLLRFIASGSKQADIDAKVIRSSAGIVVFIAERDDKAAWMAVGRAYERFALQAAALDIRNAFINQPVEVRSLRPQLQAWLGVPQHHVQLIVRYGTGPTSPHSLRRPLDAVLVEA